VSFHETQNSMHVKLRTELIWLNRHEKRSVEMLEMNLGVDANCHLTSEHNSIGTLSVLESLSKSICLCSMSILVPLLFTFIMSYTVPYTVFRISLKTKPINVDCVVPHSNIQSGNFCLSLAWPAKGNRLPESVRRSTTSQQFKSRLKTISSFSFILQVERLTRYVLSS